MLAVSCYVWGYRQASGYSNACPSWASQAMPLGLEEPGDSASFFRATEHCLQGVCFSLSMGSLHLLSEHLITLQGVSTPAPAHLGLGNVEPLA